METIGELIIIVLESMSILISPEKTADKVNDVDTVKSRKRMLIVLFTIIYFIAVIGLSFSLVLISDVIYRVVASILIVFLLYCILIFYKKVFISK